MVCSPFAGGAVDVWPAFKRGWAGLGGWVGRMRGCSPCSCVVSKCAHCKRAAAAGGRHAGGRQLQLRCWPAGGAPSPEPLQECVDPSGAADVREAHPAWKVCLRSAEPWARLVGTRPPARNTINSTRRTAHAPTPSCACSRHPPAQASPQQPHAGPRLTAVECCPQACLDAHPSKELGKGGRGELVEPRHCLLPLMPLLLPLPQQIHHQAA